VSTSPIKVAVTGAAGQIGYSLLFHIASGALFGPDTPVELRLLEITPALKSLEGVVMELNDCAFPTLAGVEIGDDPNTMFEGVNLALLVGARPRGPGMERSDLLEANGAIFTGQGKALNDHAADDVRITVTGNPANTNALIAMSNAPDIPRERFSALTRLDHNRALAQLAAKTGVSVNDIRKMTIWGNHSATQYPDIFHAEVNGQNAAKLVNDQTWLETELPPHGPEARRRHHRGTRFILSRFCRVRDDRQRTRLDGCLGRRRLAVHGRRVRWFLRGPRGPDLVLPRDHQARQLGDRPGPGDRRVLPRAHRCLDRRAGRGARRGQGSGPDQVARHLLVRVDRPSALCAGGRSSFSALGAGPMR